ncbi:unnamed protein product [Cuscuta campestris]|uniref:Uncharacterized protein n=1 Tax=Cuscuta campestris TaxID=132261 RepID=A0A484MHB4_9ASTE|nr:unnamed protein product [Cuscuta campestris]
MEGTSRTLPYSIKSIGLLGSHALGRNPKFMATTVDLGRELVRQKIGLTYVGGNVGLQGVVASTVYTNGGIVRGFILEYIATQRVYKPTYGVEYTVSNNYYKYFEMNHVVKAFIVLSGEVDTMEDTEEYLQWTTQPIQDLSFKEAFNIIQQQEEGEIILPLQITWSSKQIPKVAFFQWRLYLNLLPFPPTLTKFGGLELSEQTVGKRGLDNAAENKNL